MLSQNRHPNNEQTKAYLFICQDLPTKERDGWEESTNERGGSGEGRSETNEVRSGKNEGRSATNEGRSATSGGGESCNEPAEGRDETRDQQRGDWLPCNGGNTFHHVHPFGEIPCLGGYHVRTSSCDNVLDLKTVPNNVSNPAFTSSHQTLP
ncbi:hypothetical protein Droror1_Dr00010188 [Drosera rotundifolia]